MECARDSVRFPQACSTVAGQAGMAGESASVVLSHSHHARQYRRGCSCQSKVTVSLGIHRGLSQRVRLPELAPICVEGVPLWPDGGRLGMHSVPPFKHGPPLGFRRDPPPRHLQVVPRHLPRHHRHHRCHHHCHPSPRSSTWRLSTASTSCAATQATRCAMGCGASRPVAPATLARRGLRRSGWDVSAAVERIENGGAEK